MGRASARWTRRAPRSRRPRRTGFDVDGGEALSTAAGPRHDLASWWRWPRSWSGPRVISVRPRSAPRWRSRRRTLSPRRAVRRRPAGRAAQDLGGHVKLPGNAQPRERNPWLAFEDGPGSRAGFIERLESGTWGLVPAPFGDDLCKLAEGAATAVVKQGTPAALGRAAGSRPATLPGWACGRACASPGHAAAPGRGVPCLGQPLDRCWCWPRGCGDVPARAAVRAGGPPDVGLAGRGDHPRAAGRRAGDGPGRSRRLLLEGDGLSRSSPARWVA